MTPLPRFPARAGGALEACAVAQGDEALEVVGGVLEELAGAGAGVPGRADQVLRALQRLQEEIAVGADGACWSRASPEAAAERSQRSWRAPNG